MTNSGVTCQSFVERATDLMEEALSREEREAFQIHVASCPDCRRYLAQMHAVLKIMKAMSQRALDAPASADSARTFNEWIRRRELP